MFWAGNKTPTPSKKAYGKNYLDLNWIEFQLSCIEEIKAADSITVDFDACKLKSELKVKSLENEQT